MLRKDNIEGKTINATTSFYEARSGQYTSSEIQLRGPSFSVRPSTNDVSKREGFQTNNTFGIFPFVSSGSCRDRVLACSSCSVSLVKRARPRSLLKKGVRSADGSTVAPPSRGNRISVSHRPKFTPGLIRPSCFSGPDPLTR